MGALDAIFMITLPDIAGIGLRAFLIEGMIKRSECSDALEVYKELQEIVKARARQLSLQNIARGLYPAELEARVSKNY